MKNKISALMDGELDNEDIAGTIAQIKKTEDLRNEWAMYHLIRDTLRQSEISLIDITSYVRKKLAIEPTVLAPSPPKEHKGKVFAFAVAASMVTAVAAVAWMGGQTMNQPLDPVTHKEALQAAVKTEPTPSRIISTSAIIQLNDYLLAHDEFSSRTTIRGVTPYIRTVADPHKRPTNR